MEDVGRGDLTSSLVLDRGTFVEAHVVSRAEGRVAGLELAHLAFTLFDAVCRFEARVEEAQDVAPGTVLATVSGPAISVLTAERTALNFVAHLSGIATATRDLRRAAGGPPPAIVCTRKTTPGLRLIEKYAVRAGGGRNHRFAVDDGVLIKDNHLALSGGVKAAVDKAKSGAGHMVKIEVEVDSLEQLRQALEVGVDAVLLDNMSPELLRQAVELCQGQVLTEASGGVGPHNIAELARCGVDLISVGWITHSAPALDIGLDVTRR